MQGLRSLYLSNRFFTLSIVIVGLFIFSFFFPAFLLIPKILFFSFLAAAIADTLLLYGNKKGLHGVRFTPDKLSNGDENELRIYLESFYAFTVNLRVIDELPFQFQKRDLNFYLKLFKGETKTITYYLRPVKRGEYSFGAVNVFAYSPLGLLIRRFRFSQDKVVPVYPSYLQMRKYELMAISSQLTEYGIKKIRRIGHNFEFEQIKEYVQGDDFRTINWKATARRASLMVNTYQDERSQQVYSLIDKGRVMRMPFEGMSLLDYAINTCLVISNIALRKEDKAGFITFQHKVGTVLPASRRNNQMRLIQEGLYNQKTAYRETDFSVLYSTVKGKISQRSLLLLYTNFESLASLERQLPFLVMLAQIHLLVVIFFENTEIKDLLAASATDLKAIYNKTVAEKLAHEKKQIVKELGKHGIHSILTPPQQLSVSTINKYLELKARGLI